MKFPLVRFSVVCMLVIGLCAAAIAQETQETQDNTVPFTTKVDPSSTTLFQNVRIFDGKSGNISPASNVLVKRHRD
jgi:hypothetical protein